VFLQELVDSWLPNLVQKIWRGGRRSFSGRLKKKSQKAVNIEISDSTSHFPILPVRIFRFAFGKMPSLDAMNKAARRKKASVLKKKPEKKPSTTFSALSSEYVQDSDLDDDEKDSESENDSLPEDPADALPKSNGKLPAPDGSSSESENESESEEEDEEQSEDEAPQQSSQSLKPAK
jgi:hypothetical protein